MSQNEHSADNQIVLHPDVYPGSLVFIGISNNGTQNPFELCLATFQPDKESVQDQVPVLPCIATEQKMPKNVHDLWPKDESSFSLKQLKCSAPDKKQILISSADLLRATLLKDTSSDLPAWLNMPQWHGLEGSEPAIRQEVAFKACRSKHLHRVTVSSHRVSQRTLTCSSKQTLTSTRKDHSKLSYLPSRRMKVLCQQHCVQSGFNLMIQQQQNRSNAILSLNLHEQEQYIEASPISKPS